MLPSGDQGSPQQGLSQLSVAMVIIRVETFLNPLQVVRLQGPGQLCMQVYMCTHVVYNVHACGHAVSNVQGGKTLSRLSMLTVACMLWHTFMA